MAHKSEGDLPTITSLSRLIILWLISAKNLHSTREIEKESLRIREQGVPFVLPEGMNVQRLLAEMAEKSLIAGDDKAWSLAEIGEELLSQYRAALDSRLQSSTDRVPT